MIMTAESERISKQFVGFQSVIIELHSTKNGQSCFSSILRRNPMLKDLTSMKAHYDKFLAEVASNFEASLDPFTMHVSPDEGAIHARHVIFHPREYLATKSAKIADAIEHS